MNGYAIGWFTLSLINAGIARAQGRSGLNWWLASLFLGPIATLLLVVFDGKMRSFRLYRGKSALAEKT